MSVTTLVCYSTVQKKGLSRWFECMFCLLTRAGALPKPDLNQPWSKFNPSLNLACWLQKLQQVVCIALSHKHRGCAVLVLSASLHTVFFPDQFSIL